MANLFRAGNVFRRKHGDHAGHGLCRARVDGEHLCARICAAHRGAKQHAGQVEVVRIQRAAERLINDLDAFDAVANRTGQLRLRNLGVLAKEFYREQHGVLNLLITGATADVVFDRFLHVRVGRIWILVEQALRADDHAGRAESALHRARDGKCIGIYVPLAGRKPLDCDDMLAFELVRLLNAGFDRFAVQQHHAGAAGTLRTAVFHAGQVECIAQVGD